MPNNTTISTAEYRVTIEPQWAQAKHSVRSGLVVREYLSPKTGVHMVAIRTDHSNKLVRVPADAVTHVDD